MCVCVCGCACPQLQGAAVTASTVFFECAPGACNTDERYGNVSCAEGQQGPLCSVCRPSYAKAGSLCSECWGATASWFTTVAAVLVLVTLLVVMVRRSTGRRSELMAVGRIFLNWVQLNSAIGTFAMQAPALAKDMLNLSAASDGVSLNAFFVQCAVGFTYSGLFLSYCAFPAVAVALIGIVCASSYAVQAWQHPTQKKALKRKFGDYFKLASTVTIVVTYVKVGAAGARVQARPAS